MEQPPRNIQEVIFSRNKNLHYFEDTTLIAGQTPPGHGEGIGNPQGWIAFAAMFGALVGAIAGRGVIGAVVGALLLGGGLLLIIRIVSREALAPSLRSLGPWPLWTASGAFFGAAALFAIAGAVDALDDPQTLVVPALTFTAVGAVLFTLFRLIVGALGRRRPNADPSAPRWTR